MREARWIAAAALAALLFTWAVWYALHSAQPYYKGKSLYAWLLQHAQATDEHDQKSRDEAEFAIRQIGTNALPTLLAWISKTNTPLKKKVLAAVGNRATFKIGLLTTSDYHALTTYACGVLRSVAKPLVPDLAALLRDPDPGVRASAAFALDQIGPSAEEAVPALLESLADREAMDNAMRALKDLGVRADEIVPVALRHLSSTDVNEQLCSMWALAQCGTNAAIATTKVMQFLDNPDLSLRMSATNALRRITPAWGQDEPP